jgi:medium-chain acyl-[acyl-carrier-protein] hydrolase
LHELPDRELIDTVRRRFGGIPDAVAENAELVEVLLPALRADLVVYETYTYRDEPPLASPIVVLGGTDDTEVTAADLEGWRRETAGRFTTRRLPGGHFFLQSARRQVLRVIAGQLAPPP